ncbi:MAG: ABC transporter ATP-binding protein [Chloroflexi bacterium]|nr:ABC transporter ATP-binding protein [Chloroflexota bacterium]
MLKAEHLAKAFDDFWAVRDVTLEIPAGTVLALLGPNGAGKTTTVRMLASVLRPTRGRAWVAGYDVSTEPLAVRAHVGVLTEHHSLYRRMTVYEYLDFFADLYRLSGAQKRTRIERWLTFFGLWDFRNHRVGGLSKGMRQKLALSRALLHEPPVLLLDEPTSAMDPESARRVRQAIASLRSDERAILICTHNLTEAEALADQVAIIRRGRIVAQGTPAELKTRYLGPPEFRITFARPWDGRPPALPGVRVTRWDGQSLWYRTSQPRVENPAIVRALVQRGFDVVRLEEVPRALEDVYLKVMAQAAAEEHDAATAATPAPEVA